MPFVNELAADRAEGVIAGPSDGTRELIIVRQRVGPRERGWLIATTRTRSCASSPDRP
jgi:hypothetical protein